MPAGARRSPRSPRSPARRARGSGRARARRLPTSPGRAARRSGCAKASVLPEPVGLLARTSPPRSASGIAAVWTGNGVVDALLGEDVADGVGDAERAEIAAGHAGRAPSCRSRSFVGRDPARSRRRRRRNAISLESRIALHVLTVAAASAGTRRSRQRLIGAVEPLLEQPQPVLELGDAQVELVPVLARDQAELVEDARSRGCAVPSPSRSASPRQREVASSNSDAQLVELRRRAIERIRSSGSRSSKRSLPGSSMRPRLAPLAAPLALGVRLVSPPPSTAAIPTGCSCLVSSGVSARHAGGGLLGLADAPWRASSRRRPRRGGRRTPGRARAGSRGAAWR